MKKRKMAVYRDFGQPPNRSDRRYHSNCEGTNWPGSLRLGKNRVRRCLSLAAGMTGRHNGTSTLLRHVVAALAFRGSHCHTRKNTSHRRCDRP